jgi:hypothetical protein
MLINKAGLTTNVNLWVGLTNKKNESHEESIMTYC